MAYYDHLLQSWRNSWDSSSFAFTFPSPPYFQHNGDGRPSNANVGYAHDSNTGGRGRGYKDREDQVYQLHFDQVSQEILTRTVGCEKKDNVPNGV